MRVLIGSMWCKYSVLIWYVYILLVEKILRSILMELLGASCPPQPGQPWQMKTWAKDTDGRAHSNTSRAGIFWYVIYSELTESLAASLLPPLLELHIYLAPDHHNYQHCRSFGLQYISAGIYIYFPLACWAKPVVEVQKTCFNLLFSVCKAKSKPNFVKRKRLDKNIGNLLFRWSCCARRLACYRQWFIGLCFSSANKHFWMSFPKPFWHAFQVAPGGYHVSYTDERIQPLFACY